MVARPAGSRRPRAQHRWQPGHAAHGAGLRHRSAPAFRQGGLRNQGISRVRPLLMYTTLLYDVLVPKYIPGTFLLVMNLYLVVCRRYFRR